MTHESTYIMNMLEKIQLKLEQLSKSERKVADIILASPERAIHCQRTDGEPFLSQHGYPRLP